MANVHKWIKLCLIVYFVFVLHIVIPNNGGTQGDDLPWVIVGWLFICSLVCGVLLTFPKCKMWHTTPCFNYFLVACIFLTLPIAWSPHVDWQFHALPRLLGLWLGLGTYFVLLQCRLELKQWMIIIFILGLGSSIQSIFVILELFTPNLIPNLSKAVTQNGNFGYGIFQQKNITSSFITIGLGGMLSFFCFCDFKLYSSKVLFWISGFSISICIVSIILLNSRIGWLSSLIVITLFAASINVSSHFRVSFKRQSCLLFLIALGFISGVYFSNLLPKGLLAEHSSSNHQRVLTLTYSFYMYLKHPFIGWGYGGYEYGFQHWLTTFNPLPQTQEMMNHPHNEILFWAIEGGISSVIAIVFIVFLGIRLLMSVDCVSRITSGIILLPIILHTQVEYPLYQSSAHWLILILTIAYLDSNNLTCVSKKLTINSNKIINYFIAIVFTLSFLLLFISLHNEIILSRFENRTLSDSNEILSIPFPFLAYERYKLDIALLDILNYEKTSNPHYLSEFVRKAHDISQTRIDANLYMNLIEVEKSLMKYAEVQHDFLEAKKLFPYDSRFNDSLMD